MNRKTQPRAFEEIVKMVKENGDKDQVIASAVDLGYTQNTATIMFFKAKKRVKMQQIKRALRGRVPTEETFVKRAVEMGVRPTSAKKMYTEYAGK